MKKLQKLSALLLACAMVLLLFTACSGGSDPGAEAKAEAKVMASINDGRETKLDNDPTLKENAKKLIDSDVSASAGNYAFTNKVHIDKVDGKVTVSVVAKYDYSNTKLEQLIGVLVSDPKVDINVNQVSKWTKVGVAVKTIQGQTYIAVSVQVQSIFG